MATTRASRVRCKSVSMKRAPISTARRNAAIVFSGACPEAPRCATTHTALEILPMLIFFNAWKFFPLRHPSRIVPQIYWAFVGHCAQYTFCGDTAFQDTASKDIGSQVRRLASPGRRKEISVKTRMQAVSILLTVALLALAGSTIGAPKPKRGAERSPVDTASISAQVKHKLAMLPWYGVFDDLGYQVKGSEVI